LTEIPPPAERDQCGVLILLPINVKGGFTAFSLPISTVPLHMGLQGSLQCQVVFTVLAK